VDVITFTSSYRAQLVAWFRTGLDPLHLPGAPRSPIGPITAFAVENGFTVSVGDEHTAGLLVALQDYNLNSHHK
jgi:hypothetical protein